jgi:tRNA threonylcarbamoyladenosine biosynthesis protein TsaB
MVLDDRGIQLSALGGISVAIGPGSFTGLRVGLAVAKGICWSLKLPLAGVSTLLAAAMCCSVPSHRIMVVKDARRDEFYYAAYIRNDGLQQTIPDSVGAAGDVLHLVSDMYLPIGPGLAELQRRFGDKFSFLDEGYDKNNLGGMVAVVGREALIEGKTLDLRSATPNYIRVPKPREWKP